MQSKNINPQPETKLECHKIKNSHRKRQELFLFLNK